MAYIPNDLESLNSNADLDFLTSFNNHYVDANLMNNPYDSLTLNSKFHDLDSLSLLPTAKNKPIFLSINVQSLTSKFESLKSEILLLQAKNIHVDVIAIQETWDVKHPEILLLPGYQQFIFKKRTGMRGGGVGFYIKSGIHYQILDDCSPFENKIIEALSLKLSYPNRSIIVTSLYRSNGIITNTTPLVQMNLFLEKFDILLDTLGQKNCESYVFTDSNIDLLNLQNHVVNSYLNTILSRGYFQTICKATRAQGNAFTLIDHILTNTKCSAITTGTVLSDISDHFYTIYCPEKNSHQYMQKTTSIRIFSDANLELFTNKLGQQDWGGVYDKNDTENAFNEFWSIYIALFEQTFPLIKIKFNRNIHKLQAFMTAELLEKRKTKLELLKLSLIEPSPQNKTNFRNARNSYNTLLRNTKKTHYTEAIKANAKNSKKTWDILNSVLTRGKKTETIEKINATNGVTTEPKLIANTFNNFFTRVGKEISDSIPQVARQAEDYINYERDFPDLNLGNTTPEQILAIINKFEPKTSVDLDGVSTKMLKTVKTLIAPPPIPHLQSKPKHW